MDTSELSTALFSCEDSPAEAAGKFQAWMRSDPANLLRAAPELFVSAKGRPPAAFLAKVLSVADFDVAHISDPSLFPLEEATSLANALQEHAPGFEVRLAQYAITTIPGEPDQGRHRRIRSIEILRATLRSNRLMPFQVQLMRQEDPFVRSKAAQYIAELTNNASWYHAQLKDPDARVRSNALEALWDSEMSDAESVFREALHDAHHRVVTTALVGLWLLGKEDDAAERLFALSDSADDKSRAATAWAMGRTGDRRFFDALVKLRKDESPLVRPRAFQALRELERARREALQTA